MNKNLCSAQSDILSWSKKNLNRGTYSVTTHHNFESESIVIEISQVCITDKNIVIMCFEENDSYSYDCRVESSEACEYEFDHENFSLEETLSHAKNWIEENKEKSC